MKVLTICTSEFGKNGIVSVIMNYYNAMDKSDMKIDFVVINDMDNVSKQNFFDNNSNVYVIDRNKNPIRYLYRLVKIMKTNKYDIVHVHGNSATMCIEMIAAFVANIKIRIAHVHNSTCKHITINNILKTLFLRLCTHRFACSKSAGDWLYGKKSYTIIKNGVDIKRYRYDSSVRNRYRRKLGIKEDDLVIGHIGTFNYQKNHELLIDIFNELVKSVNLSVNCKLLMIGDGDKRNAIEEKIKTLKLDTKVVIIRSTDIVEKYMSVMDVLVLPSRFEGFPMVCVEAFCSGLYCVVSDKVSKEINICNLVEFASNEDIRQYVDKILEVVNLEREKNDVKGNQLVRDKGYDIKDSAILLKNKYKDIQKR